MALDTYAAITLADLKAALGITATTDDAQLESAINFATFAAEAHLARNIIERRYLDWIDAGSTSVLLRNSPVSAVHFVGAGSATAFVPRSTQTTDVVSTVSVTESAVVLRRVDSAGVETINSASFSAYPTSALLVAWINAVSGFSATLTQNCSTRYLHRMQSVDLRTTAPSIYFADKALENSRGDLERGILFFARSDWWGIPLGSGPRGVVVDYTAGWALASVPRDIQQAVQKIAAAAFYQRKRDPSLSSESLGDYSYAIDPAGAIEGEAASLLQRWRRIR